MDVWPACLRYLEAELPAEDVLTWLKPLQADRRDDGLVLYAPNAFVRDEVHRRYLPRIRELAAHFGGGADVPDAPPPGTRVELAGLTDQGDPKVEIL